jgi:mannonate dehydratase
MKLSLMLEPFMNKKWILAKQIGIKYAVTLIPLKSKQDELFELWDYMPLLHLKKRFEDAGLELLVLERNLPLEKIKLGLQGRDQEIKHFCRLIQNMGKVGIPILSYSFMASFGWFRTSTSTRGRGGALTSSFDYNIVKDAPVVTNISEEEMWDNYEYFITRVIPVAEEANVKLALHPDDPPISPLRGVGRIFTSVNAFQKMLKIAPSPCSGINFCQANFAAMGANIPETIELFGKQDKIFFVHFRDIKGNATNFVETFHDEGQTNMFEAMKAYKKINFNGPIRPDHTPTLEGENNQNPGYEMLGRLFAVGYMKGLLEGVEYYRNNCK